MKKLIKVLVLLCVISSGMALSQEDKRVIVISNPIPLTRKGEVVAISWDQIVSKYPKIDTADFKIVEALSGKELPWQFEFKGEKKIQNLLIQLDINSNSTLSIEIKKGKSSIVKSKTYGRYVPERKDDFAWENDKIAFRMYGKALEESPSEMAYGIDVWVKRTDRLILNERYNRGNYHIDFGDGLDFYQVGLTLGAGDIAPFTKDSIWYPKNYRRWKILDNGPLRTTFILEYDAWDVNGTIVKVEKKISLDAGSQLNRVEANFSCDKNSVNTFVIGIAKRKEPGVLFLDEPEGLMAYWEPRHGNDGTTGLGSVILSDGKGITITDKQILSKVTTTDSQPVIYYTGAVWDKANEITTSNDWFEYIRSYKIRLLNPLDRKSTRLNSSH